VGVRLVGASVSDAESAKLAVADETCGVIQAPFNRDNTQFGGFLQQATALGKTVVINRPFAMGRLLYGENAATQQEAFSFVLSQGLRGIVLTGSKNAEHVVANMKAFRAAVSTDPDDKLFSR
jgi:aryl-alcohol dehydrogenase-like predicted oxidoreductase